MKLLSSTVIVWKKKKPAWKPHKPDECEWVIDDETPQEFHRTKVTKVTVIVQRFLYIYIHTQSRKHFLENLNLIRWGIRWVFFCCNYILSLDVHRYGILRFFAIAFGDRRLDDDDDTSMAPTSVIILLPAATFCKLNTYMNKIYKVLKVLGLNIVFAGSRAIIGVSQLVTFSRRSVILVMYPDKSQSIVCLG